MNAVCYLTYNDDIFCIPWERLLRRGGVEDIGWPVNGQVVVVEHLAGEIVLLRESERIAAHVARPEVLRPAGEVASSLGIDPVCDNPLRGDELTVVVVVVLVVRTHIVKESVEALSYDICCAVGSHPAACEWYHSREELRNCQLHHRQIRVSRWPYLTVCI
jgi:hypothetical protein